MSSRFSYTWRSVAAVLAVLAFFEFTIRIFGLSRWRNVRKLPDMGWVVAGGETVRWGSEGFGVTHFVADGEVATPYSGGPNVVVMGDSHTEAFQVNDDVKYVSVAETLLREQGFAVDLRNFGRSGASMADYVWITRVLRERFHPVAMVLELDEYDFDAHAFDATQTNAFVVRSPGVIELVHNGRAPRLPRTMSLGERVSRTFAIVEHVGDRISRFQRRSARESGKKLQLETAVSVTLQAEKLREAAGGVPVILLRLPYSPYLPSALGRETFDALLQTLPWRFIDPSKAFLASRERGRDPRTFFNTPPGGGHLNAEGHSIIGRMLADELAKLLR